MDNHTTAVAAAGDALMRAAAGEAPAQGDGRPQCLPCPVCGSKAVATNYRLAASAWAQCKRKGCLQGPTRPTIEAAAEEWNRVARAVRRAEELEGNEAHRKAIAQELEEVKGWLELAHRTIASRDSRIAVLEAQIECMVNGQGAQL